MSIRFVTFHLINQSKIETHNKHNFNIGSNVTISLFVHIVISNLRWCKNLNIHLPLTRIYNKHTYTYIPVEDSPLFRARNRPKLVSCKQFTFASCLTWKQTVVPNEKAIVWMMSEQIVSYLNTARMNFERPYFHPNLRTCTCRIIKGLICK